MILYWEELKMLLTPVKRSSSYNCVLQYCQTSSGLIVLNSGNHENCDISSNFNIRQMFILQKPDINTTVVIMDTILLDESTPRLWGIVIEPTGRLVWSPKIDVNVTTRYIHIRGRMDIGSEQCLYERNTVITLTGKSKLFSTIAVCYWFWCSFIHSLGNIKYFILTSGRSARALLLGPFYCQFACISVSIYTTFLQCFTKHWMYPRPAILEEAPNLVFMT